MSSDSCVWRRARSDLLRWLVIVAAAIAVSLAIRVLLERRSAAAPDEPPASMIAQVESH